MVRHLNMLHLLKFCSRCRTVASCRLHLLKICPGCRTVTSCYRQEWIERYGLIKMIWLCPSCRFHQNIFLERQRLLQWMWMIDRQRKHSLAIILQNNDLGLLIASLSVQLPCDQLISSFNLTKQQLDMINEELELLTEDDSDALFDILQMEGVSSDNNEDFELDLNALSQETFEVMIRFLRLDGAIRIKRPLWRLRRRALRGQPSGL